MPELVRWLKISIIVLNTTLVMISLTPFFIHCAGFMQGQQVGRLEGYIAGIGKRSDYLNNFPN